MEFQGIASLSRRQRLLHKEFLKANRKIIANLKKKGITSKDLAAIWFDGHTCGKYGHTWNR